MAVTRRDSATADCKPSNADLTGKEFFFATRVGVGFGVCGDGGVIAGVITEGKPVGQHSSISNGPQEKVIAAAAIALGAKVASDADGKAVIAATTDYVYGRVIKAAQNANDLVEIQVTHEGIDRD